MTEEERIKRYAGPAFKDVGVFLLASDRLREEAMNYYDKHPSLSAGYYAMAAQALDCAAGIAREYKAGDEVERHLARRSADLAEAAIDVGRRSSQR